jgi:Holliday junction resolvasome RuvABC DNA-binding subunit
MTDHEKEQSEQDKNQAAQKDESRKRQEDQLRAAAKALKAQGFNNEQIAQQLSAKHQTAAADIKLILDQDKENEK